MVDIKLSPVADDFVADLDNCEIEFDLRLRSLRLEVVADDVCKYLPRAAEQGLLLRAAVLDRLQRFHRAGEFAHLRVGLDYCESRAHRPLAFENRREHVESALGEDLVVVLGVPPTSRTSIV